MALGTPTHSSFARRFSDRGGAWPLAAALIAANGAVFLLQCAVERWGPPFWMEEWLALSREGVGQRHAWWQLLTYMFLHADWVHLLVNSLGLYWAGREVERLCGRGHFLGIYFAGGVFGGVLQLLLGMDGPAVGASAGVCAVVLAFATLLPELEIVLLLFFVIPLRMRAKWVGRIVLWSAPAMALLAPAGPVAHWAHFGGALAGWLYARRLGLGGAFWAQRWWQEPGGEPPAPPSDGGMASLFHLGKSGSKAHEQMSPKEFISREIDPILDKINREGFQSLTREERQTLELGREKIAQKAEGAGRFSDRV